MADIWIFAEQNHGEIAEVAFELLGKGLELKSQRGDGCRLAAVLFGHGIGEATVASLGEAGADIVYVVDNPVLADYEATTYVEALTELVKRHRPEVVLAGATAIGRAFLARVAVRLRTGLTADCTALKIEGTPNKQTGETQMLLHQTRPAFGGNIMATIMTPNNRPQMATVRPKVFKRADAPTRSRKSFKVIREDVSLSPPATRLIRIVKDANEANIAASSILVAGGRGLKNAANFARLKELAQLLGGEFAASRAAVDAHWASPDRQVGQTGKAVAPRLYLCFGISGAIQHLEGIRGAEKIIAVNNDPNAPIFGVADLGIVGDAMEVMSALIDNLKKGQHGLD